ncbi:hypothetical protein DQ04_00541040 [Trypanosoma grayi]|uniref:hypothetical protein n=1 Tax=Trypanosoma grayi TaxID=71804 RepID=UPI0004F45222|nr:hypothetical protein DQ04_00541040 [Trypanosoma grayi]KEG14272.1 hypothetical protein DQ04_00541040 [Trypanosoma grayi]
MNDVELGELVRKFQAIQRQDVPNQIGERNVVEIINVLRGKNFIDLLYTVDGKEYLTWVQLRREVIDEISVNGGRMNVVDLPGSLGVHVTHIERVLPEVLEDPTIHIENGELITDEYLDSTIRAAADMLKERGFLSIAEFAKTYRFTSLFAQELLTRAVESRRLNAVLEENAMYTKQFVRSQKVILRAGLMAATRPVNLVTFFERYNLFVPLMDPIIEAVRPELPGQIDGRIYVPTHFEVSRAEQVENIYLSNGYIDYASLHRQGISQAKEFLLTRYNPTPKRIAVEAPKRRGRKNNQTADTSAEMAPVARSESHPNAGHALSSCFVADRFLTNLVVLEDLAHGDTLALDLTPHLPPAVDYERDMGILMRRLRELHPIIASCILLEGGVLVHESVLSTVKERLRTAFEKNLKEGEKKRGKKVQDRVAFGDEHEHTLLHVLSELTGLAQEQYQHALEELSAQCKDEAREIYEELAAAVEQNASVDLRRMRAKLQTSLGAAWVDLSIAARGVAWAEVQLDEAAATAVNRHLLVLRALPMVRDILLNESLDAADLYERVLDIVAVEDEQKQQPTVATFQKALRALPDKYRQSLSPILEALNGKSVEGFMSRLQTMCSTGQIAISAFHQPGKKLEREALAALRRALVERIESSTFTADAVHSGAVFAYVCSLLIHTHFHVYVELPGRAVGSAVTRLVKEAETAVGDLQDCHQLITGALNGKELGEESIEKLEQLRKVSLEGV